MTTQREEREEEVVVAAAGAAVAMGNSNADRSSRNELDFPDVFYCPLTEQIMVDPVVDTSGESFERSAVTAKDERNKVTDGVALYYPNRALKSIIERELERRDENKGSLRDRVGESLRSGFERLVKTKPTPRPLPDSFYCSITLELMREPVIDPDGRTFERDAIIHWIRANGTSPVTRNALAVSQLRSNDALRDLIEDEKERTDESLHPSIRRWKMEVDHTVETGIRPRPVDPPGPSPPDRGDGLNNDAIHDARAPGAEWDNGNPTTHAENNQNYQSEPPHSLAMTRSVSERAPAQNYPTTQAEIDARVRRLRQSESVRYCSPVGAISLICLILQILVFLFFLYG
jgi:hypothetical protein